MSKRFYITTAIDYVNGQPHVGQAYEKVVTDVIARARRSLGQEVFFLTGLDEHGQKVQQAAQAQGKSPQAYCDELAAQWKAFTVKLEITNDDFVRTTQPRHQAVVQAVLKKLHAQGDIYKAPYRGWYSWKEETFLTDKDRRPDGTFDPVWGEVKELVEENWYFRMARHQAWLTNGRQHLFGGDILGELWKVQCLASGGDSPRRDNHKFPPVHSHLRHLSDELNQVRHGYAVFTSGQC